MYTQAELDALGDKDYRDVYVESHVKSLIAHQLRCIREKLGLTQKEFAVLVGKPQSVISRLESTEYGKVSIHTLLDLAHKLDIAIIVRFASFPEFLESADDISPQRLAVDDYSTTKSASKPLTGITSSTVPTSTVPRQRQAPITEIVLHGESLHLTTQFIRNKGAVVTAGIAVTPFIGVQLLTSSLE